MKMNLKDIITTRRSVRSFSKKTISKEIILKILDMARWAPCSSECWKFVIVEKLERKKQLSQAARQSWIATAPAIIVVGADISEFNAEEKNWWRWDAYKFRDIFYIQETAAAIQNLMLTATDERLGSCWIGSFNEGDVAKIVNFPSMIRPVAMIPLGYPKKPLEKGTRKSLKEIISWETYEK